MSKGDDVVATPVPVEPEKAAGDTDSEFMAIIGGKA
jgi:hypothetical protein